MKRRASVIAASAGLATLLAAAAPRIAGTAASHAPPQVESVVFVITHRVFPDFFEVDSVRLKEEFRVGDTDYSARAVEFIPDFAYDLKAHKVLSRTPEPLNPAFRIIVKQKGVPKDTTWAFLNMPPHFGRTSLLAFQIARIDFRGRPPMMAGDSTASRVPRPPAADTAAAPAKHP
jgi:hypothetical protein